MPVSEAGAAPGAPGTARAEAGVLLQRCFIALWPDRAARQQLEALAVRLQSEHRGSRRTEGSDLHLTLAFLGMLAADQARPVAQMLAALSAPRFSWTVDRLDGFARAQVLWAGGGEEPRLAAMAQAARRGLDALHVAYDCRAFAPHVTLLRSVAQASGPCACAPITWVVSAPMLAYSLCDARGQVHYRRWSERQLR